MHYLLFYDVVPDFVERREPLRSTHLAKVRTELEEGGLVLGGAFNDPVDGAVLLFKGDSPKAAMRFAESDPYVTNGLVTGWRVREWATVVGKDAQARIGT